MDEQQTTTQTEQPTEDKRDLSWHLDRIWEEIKNISRQVEQETRRGGRMARLRFEIRGLRRDIDDQCQRLGHLVYEAQRDGDKRPTLSRVQGYDEVIERIAQLEAEIGVKEQEITELRAQGEQDPAAEDE